MPTKRASAPRAPRDEERVEFQRYGETLHARFKRSRLRFLLDDGRTVDVVTDRDDSVLRGALLRHLGAERIEGVASLDGPVEDEP